MSPPTIYFSFLRKKLPSKSCASYLVLDVVVLQLVEVLGEFGGQLLHLLDRLLQIRVLNFDPSGDSNGHGAEDEICALQRVLEFLDLLIEIFLLQQRFDGSFGEAVQQFVDHPCRRRRSKNDRVEHRRGGSDGLWRDGEERTYGLDSCMVFMRWLWSTHV
jgi:hypothetical protein